MKSSTQLKVIATFIFGVVALSVVWGIHDVMEQNRSLEAASEAGWAIDTSPDSLQRNLRITFALLLGAVALWSRQATKFALFTALTLFMGIEFITWFMVPRIAFDRTEIEYHLLAGALILIAVILWIRGTNYLMIALLAPAYILMEFIVWYISTIRLRALLGVDQLQPPTAINNLFFGVHWWHVSIMALSVLMIVCGIRSARNADST